MISFDYHSHNWRCGHAVGELTDYIEQALALGMCAFGVSDHGPAYWLPGDHAQPRIQMALSQLPGYVAEAVALKARFAGQITVSVGLEADFIEGQEAALAALLAAHPFDHVLGSVHYVGGTNVFDASRWEREEPEAVFREYYHLVGVAARTGLFDILSHLTVIETYAPPIPDSLAAELYPKVAAEIAAAGCVVEVNTSAYRKCPQWNEPYPNRRMLQELIRCGVPLTFGSDCHQPSEVGFARDEVAMVLAELGVEGRAQPRRVFHSPILTVGG